MRREVCGRGVDEQTEVLDIRTISCEREEGEEREIGWGG